MSNLEDEVYPIGQTNILFFSCRVGTLTLTSGVDAQSIMTAKVTSHE
jgi:hypothetical protein